MTMIITTYIACMLLVVYYICAVQMSIEKELKNIRNEMDSLGFCIAELRRELDKARPDKQKKNKATVQPTEHQGTLIQ